MKPRQGRLVIDGSYGEGGGQILRTAVALSILTGRAIRIERIRAGRPRPGLAAQHVTSVRAGATICGARVWGEEIGSETLEFEPGTTATAGRYHFDVAAARQGGSAGAASLVLQTVLVPLALAEGRSRLAVRGGTHMAWSPPFDYLRDVWLPALGELGIAARVGLRAWGWFPVGRGEILTEVDGVGSAMSKRLHAADWQERGRLLRVSGRAVAAKLPAHITERMAKRARNRLAELGVPVAIAEESVTAACSGAGIFLCAEYEDIHCGFNALGKRGKPAEQVADEAVAALFAHAHSNAALDLHLADQMLLPLALTDGTSRFSVEQISRHLRTNAWVIERFGLASVHLAPRDRGGGLVTIDPSGF